MFSVDKRAQDIWVGDDSQGGSIVSSVSAQSRSEPETFAPENVSAIRASSSVANGKGPLKIPGLLRTADAALLRNGQPTLPAEKAFAIQIGWRLFRLSGASIMSDGKSCWMPQ